MRTVGVPARVLSVLATSSLAVVALAASAAPAHADTAKALTAAKSGMPGDAAAIFGLDVTGIQKSQLYKSYLPKLMTADGQKAIDGMKTACKMDVLTVVQGMVIGIGAGNNDGALYVAFSTADRTRVSACAQVAIQNGEPGSKATITQDGAIMHIHVVKSDPADKPHDTFFGWVGKDVLVIPFNAEDRTAVDRWMGGKGAFAKSDANKGLAKLDTSAQVWFTGAKPKSMDGSGVDFKSANGTVKIAGGTVGVDVRATMASPADATTLAGQAKTQLDQAKAAVGSITSIANVLNSVQVTTAGDQLLLKASASEADLSNLIDLGLMGMAGKNPPPPPVAPAPAPAPAGKPAGH